MEALNLYTSSDKCFCASTDFPAAAVGKIILSYKLETEGYTTQCVVGVPASPLPHSQQCLCVRKCCSGLMATGERSMEPVQRITRTNERYRFKPNQKIHWNWNFSTERRQANLIKNLKARKWPLKKDQRKLNYSMFI